MVYYDAVPGQRPQKRVINHNTGAKALADYPYSVILKLAKNRDADGGVILSFSRPADCRPKSKRQYEPCLGTGGILKYIKRHMTLSGPGGPASTGRNCI